MPPSRPHKAFNLADYKAFNASGRKLLMRRAVKPAVKLIKQK